MGSRVSSAGACPVQWDGAGDGAAGATAVLEAIMGQKCRLVVMGKSSLVAF